MFKSFPVCHIKAKALFATMLPPVLNFLPPPPHHQLSAARPHQVCFMWFPPPCRGPNPPVYPPAVRLIPQQLRNDNQRRAGDMLNPLSGTHDARLQKCPRLREELLEEGGLPRSIEARWL